MEKKKEALVFLSCDKAVNETVALTDKFLVPIINVVKKENDKINYDEVELLKLAAHAFISERILARIEERQIRNIDEKIDLGCLCSSDNGSCLNCTEDMCKLVKMINNDLEVK